MEENVQPSQVDESINTNMAVEVPTSTAKSFLPYLLVVVIGTILAVTFYFYNQTQVLKSQLTVSVSPSPVVSSTASTDPYENWNTYSNSVHNVSFKYPLGWQITKEDDQAKLNASIKLAKDQATIHMIFGVDGIGGSGMDYEGTPFILDGNKVFKYKAHSSYDNSESVGITDTLKESLGVLMLDKKTYVINLKYPTKYIESGESKNLEKTFDEILSTFKFSNNYLNESKKVTGYIKSFNSVGNMSLVIDEVEYLNDNTAPNGFKINNPSIKLDTILVSPQVIIKMNTYSHVPSGDFNWNQKLETTEFASIFLDDLVQSKSLYDLVIENGKVTNITERYIP